MNIFKERVISLTSKQITMTNEYQELKNAFDTTSFSDSTKRRLKTRLIKKKQALDHLENNLKMNIKLSEVAK